MQSELRGALLKSLRTPREASDESDLAAACRKGKCNPKTHTGSLHEQLLFQPYILTLWLFGPVFSSFPEGWFSGVDSPLGRSP